VNRNVRRKVVDEQWTVEVKGKGKGKGHPQQAVEMTQGFRVG